MPSATTRYMTTASTVTASSANLDVVKTPTALWTWPTAPPSIVVQATLDTRDSSRSRSRPTTAPAASPPPRAALSLPLMMTLKQHSHALQVVLITPTNVTMITETWQSSWLMRTMAWRLASTPMLISTLRVELQPGQARAPGLAPPARLSASTSSTKHSPSTRSSTAVT